MKLCGVDSVELYPIDGGFIDIIDVLHWTAQNSPSTALQTMSMPKSTVPNCSEISALTKRKKPCRLARLY